MQGEDMSVQVWGAAEMWEGAQDRQVWEKAR